MYRLNRPFFRPLPTAIKPVPYRWCAPGRPFDCYDFGRNATPSHMRRRWSPRCRAGDRTDARNVILAKSCAHQEAARRSIKNSTLSDSIVRGRAALGKLDEALRAQLEQLDACFGQLSDLARVAFDESVNTELRLAASIRIAEAVDVPNHQILRSNADLDTFMKE